MRKYPKKAMSTPTLPVIKSAPTPFFFSSRSITNPQKLTEKEVYFVSLDAKEQQDIVRLRKAAEYYRNLV